MIIQNEREALRIETAINGDMNKCHKLLTGDDRFCINAQGREYAFNSLCSRLFPKITKNFDCPCDSYNLKYIRRKCMKELALWHNRR